MRQGSQAGGRLALHIGFAAGVALAAPAMAGSQEAATPWRSTTIASVNDTCDAFFHDTVDPTVGRNFTSWVAVADLDAHGAIAQMKRAASSAGLDVRAEDYHGTAGSLTLFVKNPAEGDGFPMFVDVDGALGVVSVHMRANPGQFVGSAEAKQLICGLVGEAGGTPLPAEKKNGGRSLFSNPFKSAAKRQQEAAQEQDKKRDNLKQLYFGAMDALYQRALAAGKAIVMMPSVNLDAKYADGEVQLKHAQFWADETSTTIWQAADEPKNVIKVGYDAAAYKTGLHGYFHHFAADRAFYLLYIVDPGTYSITGHTVEVERSTLPEASSTKKSAKPTLGQISLRPVKNTEYYQTQAWFDAVYADRTIKSDYCSLIIDGGPCVQWNSSTSTVRDQLSDGGYRTITQATKVDGLVVATKLTREFASFKVAPGEAVMVDGFYAQQPNVQFDKDACALESGGLQCDMREYTLVRIPAHLEDLKNAQAQASLQFLPGLNKILDSMQLRQPQVAAKGGNFAGALGQNFTLKQP